MSVELIAVIITAASLFVTVVGGLFAVSAWILRQMDARFDKVDARFEKVDEQFNNVNEQFKEMATQMSGLRAELNDVKVAVARLEGPHQRLILPPH